MSVDRAIMSARRTALLGAMLVAVGPTSLALYTPAMPELVEIFGTTDAAVKLTLTAYFAGFAIAQLFCGPLADAFGRKPATLCFLSIYVVSSALATFAPTVEFMIAARTLQGIGAAVGIAVSRAIVRDQFSGQESARLLNSIAMMLAIGPALGPALGGFVLELFGWRAVFWCMILYGVILLLSVQLFQKETNPEPGMHHLRPRQLASNYAGLLQDPRFLAPALLIGFGLGNLYALATILPFVLIGEVGLTPYEFGLSMIIQSGSFITGTIVTGRLLKRMDAQRLVPYGVALWSAAAVLMCALPLTQALTVATVMLPVGLFAFSLALILPASMTETMAPFPHIAGAVSSLLGFLQLGIGILSSLLVTLVVSLVGNPVAGLAFVIPAALVTGAIASFFLKSRITRPAIAE